MHDMACLCPPSAAFLKGHSSVESKHSHSTGMSLSAGISFDPGDKLLLLPPLAFALDDALLQSRCSYCFDKGTKVGCEGVCAGAVRYCSHECIGSDAAAHHASGECFLFELFRNSERLMEEEQVQETVTMRLALRLLQAVGCHGKGKGMCNGSCLGPGKELGSPVQKAIVEARGVGGLLGNASAWLSSVEAAGAPTAVERDLLQVEFQLMMRARSTLCATRRRRRRSRGGRRSRKGDSHGSYGQQKRRVTEMAKDPPRVEEDIDHDDDHDDDDDNDNDDDHHHDHDDGGGGGVGVGGGDDDQDDDHDHGGDDHDHDHGDDAEDQGRLMDALCKVRTNAVQAVGTGGSAVYTWPFSWLNHSCRPNCRYSFFAVNDSAWQDGKKKKKRKVLATGSTGAMQEEYYHNQDSLLHADILPPYGGPAVLVETICTVAQGEELFISYTDLVRPREIRQADLRRRFLFECTCSRCTPSVSASASAFFPTEAESHLSAIGRCPSPACHGWLNFHPHVGCSSSDEEKALHVCQTCGLVAELIRGGEGSQPPSVEALVDSIASIQQAQLASVNDLGRAYKELHQSLLDAWNIGGVAPPPPPPVPLIEVAAAAAAAAVPQYNFYHGSVSDVPQVTDPSTVEDGGTLKSGSSCTSARAKQHEWDNTVVGGVTVGAAPAEAQGEWWEAATLARKLLFRALAGKAFDHLATERPDSVVVLTDGKSMFEGSCRPTVIHMSRLAEMLRTSTTARGGAPQLRLQLQELAESGLISLQELLHYGLSQQLFESEEGMVLGQGREKRENSCLGQTDDACKCWRGLHPCHHVCLDAYMMLASICQMMHDSGDCDNNNMQCSEEEFLRCAWLEKALGYRLLLSWALTSLCREGERGCAILASQLWMDVQTCLENMLPTLGQRVHMIKSNHPEPPNGKS